MELLGAHSCQHCQNLVLDFDQQKDFDEEKIDGSLDEFDQHQFEPSPERRKRIIFDFTIRNLRNAATEGCPVCEGYWKALGIVSSLPSHSNSRLTVERSERIHNTIRVGTSRMNFEVSLRNRSFHKTKVISYTTPRRLRTELSSFPQNFQNFKIVATSGMLKNSTAAAKD
jgi:hypothetical protein